MAYVVLDTDVASQLVRGRLPAPMMARLAGLDPVVTFVTVGEMTEWSEVRRWGRRTVDVLEEWLGSVVVMGYDEEVARVWGRLSAWARREGRPRPVNDFWIAACCLAARVPLATLNTKDYAALSEHHGLKLATSSV